MKVFIHIKAKAGTGPRVCLMMIYSPSDKIQQTRIQLLELITFLNFIFFFFFFLK